tara:strand:+ start:465 stop:902 length:438 start_codon:yes stop_codon:yes gene_type:complete
MSTLVVDTLTGKSTATTLTIGSTPVVSASANSLTIRGEGSAQTSVQQGLCKAWAQIDGTSTAHIDDSFNCGGITDNGTGDYSTAITSAFSDVSNIVAVGMEHVNSTSSAVDIANSSTSNMRLKSFDGGSASDREHLGFLVHGDLA